MKTNYDKQAESFLKETKTTIKVVFKEHGLYFPNDKEKRDIYDVTLMRGRYKYSFTFGQSIYDSQIRIETIKGKVLKKYTQDDKDIKGIYNRKNNTFSKEYFNIHRFNLFGCKVVLPKEPSAYDILACVKKYNPYSFKDFCDSYGYDTDSRNAKKIFFAVVEQWLQISGLYNEQELELLRKIQ